MLIEIRYLTTTTKICILDILENINHTNRSFQMILVVMLNAILYFITHMNKYSLNVGIYSTLIRRNYLNTLCYNVNSVL